MNCGECRGTDMEKIPYAAFEKAQHTFAKTFKILLIIILVEALLIFASNCAWLIYLNQFDFSSEDSSTSVEAAQEGGGINIVGGGDIDYGTESQNNDTNP